MNEPNDGPVLATRLDGRLIYIDEKSGRDAEAAIAEAVRRSLARGHDSVTVLRVPQAVVDQVLAKNPNGWSLL